MVQRSSRSRKPAGLLPALAAHPQPPVEPVVNSRRSSSCSTSSGRRRCLRCDSRRPRIRASKEWRLIRRTSSESGGLRRAVRSFRHPTAKTLNGSSSLDLTKNLNRAVVACAAVSARRAIARPTVSESWSREMGLAARSSADSSTSAVDTRRSPNGPTSGRKTARRTDGGLPPLRCLKGIDSLQPTSYVDVPWRHKNPSTLS